jgi:hypothetical protein
MIFYNFLWFLINSCEIIKHSFKPRSLKSGQNQNIALGTIHQFRPESARKIGPNSHSDKVSKIMVHNQSVYLPYRVTPKTTQLSSFRILLTVSKIWILPRWVEFEKIKHKNFPSQMYSRIMRIHVKKSHSVNYFCWEQWVVNEFWG